VRGQASHDRVDPPSAAPSAHEPDHSPLDAIDDTGEQQQQQQQIGCAASVETTRGGAAC
jgi:hypothetical protein